MSPLLALLLAIVAMVTANETMNAKGNIRGRGLAKAAVPKVRICHKEQGGDACPDPTNEECEFVFREVSQKAWDKAHSKHAYDCQLVGDSECDPVTGCP